MEGLPVSAWKPSNQLSSAPPTLEFPQEEFARSKKIVSLLVLFCSITFGSVTTRVKEAGAYDFFFFEDDELAATLFPGIERMYRSLTSISYLLPSCSSGAHSATLSK
jgi:hypothetical protein